MTRSRSIPLGLLPAILLLGILFAGGMSFAILESLRPLFSVSHYRALLNEPELRASILATFLVSTAATAIATCLGLMLALALRSFAPGSRLLNTLLQIPIAIPHLAMAALVLDVLSQSGLISRILFFFHLIGQPSAFPELLHDRYSIGIILTYVLKETPFIALVALATLGRSVTEYEWAAATLGASRWQRFRHVTLPLIAPSVVSASLIVFAFIFGSFEIPFLLGKSYPPMLGVLVQRRYMSPQLDDRPDAIAAGILMSVVSALFVVAYLRLSVRLVGERPALF
jgi:putative spermidine/putrescine transport system permease protein